jgi:hypothetical protein
MSSISEESETGDDDLLDDEFIVCNDDNNNHTNEQKNRSSTNLSVENCLGDLNSFKEVSTLFPICNVFPLGRPSN